MTEAKTHARRIAAQLDELDESDEDEETITLQYQPRGRAARRLVFEPTVDGYERREEVWSGCGYWRQVGCEPVEGVEIDAPEEVFEDE